MAATTTRDGSKHICIIQQMPPITRCNPAHLHRIQSIPVLRRMTMNQNHCCSLQTALQCRHRARSHACLYALFQMFPRQQWYKASSKVVQGERGSSGKYMTRRLAIPWCHNLSQKISDWLLQINCHNGFRFQFLRHVIWWELWSYGSVWPCEP